MSLTTYDDIWKKLLDIIGTSRELLPTDEEDIYAEIHNAVDDYNIDADEDENNVSYDDVTETLSRTLNINGIKLIALYIKKNILQSELEYFEQVYQYDLKEVKSKFFRDQVSSRTESINKVESEIDKIWCYGRDRDFN